MAFKFFWSFSLELVYKNEKILFLIALIISTIFWLILLAIPIYSAVALGSLWTVAAYGIAFIIIYIFLLIAQSGFITYLKGTGVKISQDQYPDLYKKLISCCDKTGLENIPEAYLLRTDIFNALATRFLGRHFIVLFTDVVDALEQRPSAIDFYIGHEVGHIHRKHLLWGWYIFPAKLLPLLGAALCRAEEYTCDRYGVACCDSEDDVITAIAAIAAGDSRWKSFNAKAYTLQVQETSKFWMSLNELTSDYPWMTRRMVNAIAMKQGKRVKLPSRNIFAWLISTMLIRFGYGSLFISIIGTAYFSFIATAIAIPAYQQYVLRAEYAQFIAEVEPLKKEVENYATIYQNWPTSMKDLGRASDKIIGTDNKYNIGMYENGIIGVYVGDTVEGEEKFIIVQPVVEEGQVYWQCYGQNISETSLPATCR